MTDAPPTEDPRPVRPARRRLAGRRQHRRRQGQVDRRVRDHGARRRPTAGRSPCCSSSSPGDWAVGEEKVGRQLGVDWWALGEGFTWDTADPDHDRQVAAAAWEKAKAVIDAGDHQLVILDEVTYLLNWGWIDTDEFVATIRDRPPKTNVVATGRDAPPALVDVADTVTEMREVKHAYRQGIRAKRGIDY